MPDTNDSEVRRIAEKIACYLRAHPYAADTIEGIAEWWLPSKGIEVSASMIQQALNDLCAQSVVVCHAHPNGNNIYSSQQAQDE